MIANFAFPGTSLGDCSTKDLKSLIDTLKIDIKNLESSTLEEAAKALASHKEDFFENDDVTTSADHNDETSSPVLEGHQVNTGDCQKLLLLERSVFRSWL